MDGHNEFDEFYDPIINRIRAEIEKREWKEVSTEEAEQLVKSAAYEIHWRPNNRNIALVREV